MSPPVSEKAPCCCKCTCAQVPDELLVRIAFQAYGCPELAVCSTSEVWEGTLLAQPPGTEPPGGASECSGNLQKYWKGRASLSCGIPTDPVIEVVCCPIEGGAREMQVRINGQSWRPVSDADQCDCYWALASIGASEIDTDPSCCGTPHMQLYCTPADDIGVPNCDLVDTGGGS